MSIQHILICTFSSPPPPQYTLKQPHLIIICFEWLLVLVLDKQQLKTTFARKKIIFFLTISVQAVVNQMFNNKRIIDMYQYFEIRISGLFCPIKPIFSFHFSFYNRHLCIGRKSYVYTKKQ